MHAALHDDVGVALGRLAGELERVADHIGNAMEDLRRHVVVGKHDGVAGPLQLVDGLDVRREARPLDGRDHPRHLLVKMGGLARHLRGVGEIGQRRRDQFPRRLKRLFATRYGRNLRCHGPYSRQLFPYMLRLSIYGALKHPAQGRAPILTWSIGDRTRASRGVGDNVKVVTEVPQGPQSEPRSVSQHGQGCLALA